MAGSGILAGGGSGSGDAQGQEPILPAVLEFPETHQELFLRHIISELDVNVPHFKLAPVYSLYLCARWVIHYGGLSIGEEHDKRLGLRLFGFNCCLNVYLSLLNKNNNTWKAIEI